ncbi:MAG: flavin monoamine oxidase family protein [Bacillota bacterium]
MTNDFDILVIGAGASGLMAARELVKRNKKVAIIEARDRLGGRIHTSSEEGFTRQIETGAEFIHGNLPLTVALLKEAGVRYNLLSGETYQVKKGKLLETDEFIDDFPELIDKLKGLKSDMPFYDFLEIYFNDEKYRSLKKSVAMYAEGYDAADIKKVSSFALRDEWINESSSQAYRIEGGYKKLINFLSEEVISGGGLIYLSNAVKEIRCEGNKVEVICRGGKAFLSDKAIITVPLGVLQSHHESESHIKITPLLSGKVRDAIGKLGFGKVIKIFMEFKDSFWESRNFSGQNIRRMPELDFVLSDAPIPTWWSQFPEDVPMLTGWLAGPKAVSFSEIGNTEVIRKAIESLSYIFGVNTSFLNLQIKTVKAVDWLNDPFALGAYSYTTVESSKALEVLRKPLNDKLYFAGEAIYQGNAMGTVEAALISGKHAAGLI